MSEVGELFIKIKSTFDGSALKQAERQMSSFGGVMTAVKNGMLIAGGIAIGMGSAIVGAATIAIKKAGEQKDAEYRLVEAMKQAGTYSKLAADGYIQYASALQKIVPYSDEAILAVGRILTNFGIEGDVLDKLTLSVLDLATAKRMDLASAADLVAKTVGSSTNALSRYGIEIKGTTDKTERAALVINGIAGIWGGSAKAAGETFSGKLEIMKNRFDEIQESIGIKLMPVAEKFVKMLETKFLPAIEKIATSKNMETVINWIGSLVEGMGLLIGQSDDLSDYTKKMSKLNDEIKKEADTLKGSLLPAIKKVHQEKLDSLITEQKALKNNYKEKQTIDKKEEKDTKDITKNEKVATKEKLKMLKAEEDYETEVNARKKAERQQIFEQTVGAINATTTAAQGAADLELQRITNSTNTKIEAETKKYNIERDRIINSQLNEEAKATALELLQGEYNNNIANINAEAAKKERKEKEKLKGFMIAEAISNTALGVTKAFAQGGVLGFVTGALITIAGALQVAKIQEQKFAKGVRNFMGGLALVGEQGPELVSLPRGSNVYTHAESQQMLAGAGGIGGNIIVNVSSLSSRRQAKDLAGIIGTELFNKVKKSRRI